MRRYLTPDERFVQRVLGDPIKTVERALQVSRREVCFDQLADQLEREYPSSKWRGFFVPMAGPSMMQVTGGSTQTVLLTRGLSVVNFNSSGTDHTITVTKTITMNGSGIAPGGNGGNTDASGGNQDSASGGSGGESTTGTLVTLVQGKSYALTVRGGGTGINLSLVETPGPTTLVLLGKGNAGSQGTLGPAGGSGGTGTNRFQGGSGGDAGRETSPRPATVGGAQANGAGGGGAGITADGGDGPTVGGAGKDEAGQATGGSPQHGGRGGGFLVNGVSCGYGGGGAGNDNVGSNSGTTGGPAGFKLAA